DRTVGELDDLDVLKRVGAVHAGAEVDERPDSAGALGFAVVGLVTGEDDGVGAGSAVDGIVTTTAGKLVVGTVADNGITTGSADHVLDQRGGIAVVKERIGDVAGGVVPRAEAGELGRGSRGPGARVEVDGKIGRVVGEIVGVGAAAIPQRHEDLAAGGKRLAD